jgi:hypothetical protein
MPVVYIHWEETSKYVKNTEDVACEPGTLLRSRVSSPQDYYPVFCGWPINSSRLEFDSRNGEKDLLLPGDKPLVDWVGSLTDETRIHER